jgi:SAM-dependent methyltransferase
MPGLLPRRTRPDALRPVVSPVRQDAAVLPARRSWDERYAADAGAASRPPSETVLAALRELPDRCGLPDRSSSSPDRTSPPATAADELPRRAVDVAAGAGRHALLLAGRGWSVTAVDSSAVGLARCRAEAERRGLPVETVLADALAWSPPHAVDLVLAAYVQLGVPGLRRLGGWLRPGGHLVTVGHARDNLAGPGAARWNPAHLHAADELRAAASGLQVVRLEQVRRTDERGSVLELVLVARAG